jgi:hypothetical protein
MALTRASAAVVKTEELVNNRNLIINGAMQIAQRNTSVTGITTANYYTADRWFINPISAGTWTSNVESSGPTNTEFRSSANVICTTADSSLAASDLVNIQYRFEGQNVQGIKKGTSAAESLTLSFWVKSSNTGTYICEFTDVDNTRHISKSYTIDAANTWEKKTITLPPDTTGLFDNDNELSFLFSFHLAAGSDRTSGTLADTAWVSIVQANRVVGQLNLANAVGNYFAWTGVQLEIGSTATPFERRPFGTELALCLRYYEKSYRQSVAVPTNSSLNGFSIAVPNKNLTGSTTNERVQYIVFNESKRAAPTITFYTLTNSTAGSWEDGGGTAIAMATNGISETGFACFNNANVATNTQLAGHWVASSEL